MPYFHFTLCSHMLPRAELVKKRPYAVSETTCRTGHMSTYDAYYYMFTAYILSVYVSLLKAYGLTYVRAGKPVAQILVHPEVRLLLLLLDRLAR